MTMEVIEPDTNLTGSPYRSPNSFSSLPCSSAGENQRKRKQEELIKSIHLLNYGKTADWCKRNKSSSFSCRFTRIHSPPSLSDQKSVRSKLSRTIFKKKSKRQSYKESISPYWKPSRGTTVPRKIIEHNVLATAPRVIKTAFQATWSNLLKR